MKKEKYGLLIENMPNGFAYHRIIIDREGNPIDYIFLEVNPAFEKMTGLTRQQILGRKITEVIPGIIEEDFDWIGVYGKVASQGETIRFKSYFEPLERWYEITAYSNETNFFATVFHDITEGKKTEIELIKSEERIKQYLDIAGVMILVLDTQGNIQLINRRGCEILCCKHNDIIGINWFDNFLPEEICGNIKAYFIQIASGQKEPIDYNENNIITRTGKKRTIAFYNTLLKDDNGNIVGVLCSGEDITERKTAEKELKISRKKLEEAYCQLEKEVNKASEIHKMVLPDKIPQTENISIAAQYHPATQMGGDSYNIIKSWNKFIKSGNKKSGNKLVIYLADVMGHGLDGAMISIFIKEAISSYIVLNKEELFPQKILQHLSRQYYQEKFPDEQLICIFLGVVDLHTYELKYSSAGFQVNPLVMMGNGEKKKLDMGGLFISNTLPLEILTFEEQSLTLTPGSTILITTDGLTEQDNGEEFFKEYFEDIFYNNSHLPPEAIVQAINKDFCLFNHNSLTGTDDITYLVLQVNRGKKEKYNFEINSSFDELESLYEKAADIVKRLTVEFPGIDNLITCFHEVVVNAIEHGNKFDPNKKISIDLTITSEYVLAEVEDEGEGFNWCEKIDQPIDMEGDSDRGRGIPMTRMLSGNLFYNDKGNKVTLVVEVNK